MSNLAQKKCQPCKIGGPSLPQEEAEKLLRQLNDWEFADEQHIIKSWKFKDYKNAWDFVNKISEIAEAEGHHPYISFTWGLVKVKLWTHAVQGLSENDFILASKIDSIKN